MYLVKSLLTNCVTDQNIGHLISKNLHQTDQNINLSGNFGIFRTKMTIIEIGNKNNEIRQKKMSPNQFI